MKFGKLIQKRQLDIPEYAQNFVDYKALKKLIKRLSSTPVIQPRGDEESGLVQDLEANLQANKPAFFFRLDRELEKVNHFYTLKEDELKVRLRLLLDKKRSLQLRHATISRTSAHYVALEQGFRQFSKDLNKLQQFVEINATAFSKILKKWDKTSKSQTKELYISRAVEVQSCFNRDVISELSDQATQSLLDCAAWAEGEVIDMPDADMAHTVRPVASETVDVDSEIQDALNAGDIDALKDFIQRLGNSIVAREHLTRAFLNGMNTAPEMALIVLFESSLIDLYYQDEINGRNCLHRAAMYGRGLVLRLALQSGVDATTADAYGRIPLHYASMHGQVQFIRDLTQAAPNSVDSRDLDGFTPLIHAIVNYQLACVRGLLECGARVNPESANDHVPLNLACRYGSVEIVSLLLQQRPEILPDAEGLCPQHLVARSGKNANILLLLRDYGADLNQPDRLYQWTPLFHAASEGHLDCLQTLLQCGVRPDVLDEKGLSALYYATWEGHLECMKLLIPMIAGSGTLVATPHSTITTEPSTTGPMGAEAEGIPDLSLPPPIIPTRRYGHNFLETKTLAVISFENENHDVRFYDASKYPASRLLLSPRSSDALPQNLLLPLQEEAKVVSFQIDQLDMFSLDFDIFPAFGKKVIAKGSVPSEVFMGKTSSSGFYHCALLDPRLRCIGQVDFKFQVIKPFSGVPLEITPSATYWKATSKSDWEPTPALVTGSSLSGEYVRLFVQLTKDHVPILYPRWTIGLNADGLPAVQHPIAALTGNQISAMHRAQDSATMDLIQQALSQVHQHLATHFFTLAEALSSLPSSVRVDLHILYPNPAEEQSLHLGPTSNINDYVDALLNVVFNHARRLRSGFGESVQRSIVFTSFNKDICTALNWKQPNCESPFLLCS